MANYVDFPGFRSGDSPSLEYTNQCCDKIDNACDLYNRTGGSGDSNWKASEAKQQIYGNYYTNTKGY